MPRIIKFVLFLLLLGIVFELGFLSSYIIITSQPPDIEKIIDMRISRLTDIWDSITANFDKSPTAETFNVTNVDAVANTLKDKTQLSGINVDTLRAIVPENSIGDNITVTLTATGYKEEVISNNVSQQVVIKKSEIYSINATAIGKKRSRGINVDVNSIQVTALKSLSW